MEWRVTVGSGESSSEREREGGKGDARDFLGLVIFSVTCLCDCWWYGTAQVLASPLAFLTIRVMIYHTAPAYPPKSRYGYWLGNTGIRSIYLSINGFILAHYSGHMEISARYRR